MELNKKSNICKINELELFDFLNLDKELLHIIVGIILKVDYEKIDHNFSWFEANSIDEEESIYIILNGANCLQIELSLYKNTADMYVGVEKEPIYEMYEVNNLSRFKNELEKWFSYDIFQKFLKSNDMIIFNSFYTNNKELLYKSKNISFFFKNKKDFEFSHFNSWI